jgi:uncharacterized protein
MKKLLKSKLYSGSDNYSTTEYENCINDLINHEMIVSMNNFTQHGNVSCLEHCINVSYSSYIICKRLGLDYRSAARGGLLHDFFLYDWHTDKPYKGLHGLVHPRIALNNAIKYFDLNEKEKDIIQKHMWPLTMRPPRYKESFIVLCVDKYCAFMETVTYKGRVYTNKLFAALGKKINV